MLVGKGNVILILADELSFKEQIKGGNMLKIPAVIVFAIIALNITMFTIMLQLDLLVVHSLFAKIACWALTIFWWFATYINRKKYYTIRVPK
jgi:hypothetical protein